MIFVYQKEYLRDTLFLHNHWIDNQKYDLIDKKNVQQELLKYTYPHPFECILPQQCKKIRQEIGHTLCFY